MIITQKPYFTNEIKMETEEPKAKVIRRAAIARELLHRNCKLIDLKPDKTDPDGKRSVFIFEDNDYFQEVFQKVLDENKKTRDNAENEKLRKQLDELQQKFDDLTKTMSNNVAEG